MIKLLTAVCVLGLSVIQAWAGAQEVVMGANGNSAPIPLMLAGWNPVGLLLTFSEGASLTCTVQVSGDGYNIRDNRGTPIPMTNWNNHDTMVNAVANANGNIYFPVIAVRLQASNWINGTCTLAVIGVGP